MWWNLHPSKAPAKPAFARCKSCKVQYTKPWSACATARQNYNLYILLICMWFSGKWAMMSHEMPWKSRKHVRILSQSNVFYKKLASFPNGDWSLFFLGRPLQETFLSMACIHQLVMVYNDWALALPLGSDICNQSRLVVCSLHHLSRTKFNKT